MKTIIKLSIVVLIVHAGFQAARSYYEYHNFRHEVHMETLKAGRHHSDDMKRHILDMAAARGHEMTWDDVDIAIDKEFITIDMRWLDTIELIPRYYSRTWPYEGRVQVPLGKPDTLMH
jgi:hypothetical protein